MDSLGIDVDASDSDNMRTFKRVTVSTEIDILAQLSDLK